VSAVVALGASALVGIGGALIASTTPASAGTATGVAYTCAAPAPVGTITGITADVSETPNLPATDQWGTTYTETPSVTLNVPGSLVGLGASFGQSTLGIDQVTLTLDSSGFTQDPSQTVVSPDTQTVTVDTATETNGASVTFSFPSLSFTTTTGTAQTDTISLDPAFSLRVLTAVTIGCTAGTSPTLDSVAVHAPVPEPPVVVTPQSATVSNGQCVTIDVLAGSSDQNDTTNTGSVTVTTQGTYGVATANSDGSITYCTSSADNPTSQTADSFKWAVYSTSTPQESNIGTVNVSINFLTCSAGAGNPAGGSTGGTAAPCNLNQLILLPVTPGQIILSQTSSLPTDVLGSSFCSGGTTPGIVLNGQEQTVCGEISPMTVTNATGLDSGWTLTGQTTDFVDPADANNATLNNCDTTGTYNNHCIPGGNLSWSPVAAVAQNIVPGDTAQVAPGAGISLPAVQAAAASTNPEIAALLQGNVQSNPVVEPSPDAGLHTLPAPLCSTAVGMAGGTFLCGAALELAVPASVANPVEPGYEATLTLTLTL
jgi:hypothetical protein